MTDLADLCTDCGMPVRGEPPEMLARIYKHHGFPPLCGACSADRLMSAGWSVNAIKAIVSAETGKSWEEVVAGLSPDAIPEIQKREEARQARRRVN